MTGKNKLIRVTIATPNNGGPIVYTKILQNFLPQHGYEVRVVNFKDVSGYPKIIRHFVFFLKVWFSALRSDIVYGQDPVSTGLPALIASKLSGARYFQKIVGDYAWEQGSQRSGVTDFLDSFSTHYEGYTRLVKFFKNIQTFVANRAEKIIVPSNYLKKIVCNWGVDEKKITVIYNSFKKPEVKESREKIRSELGFEFPTIVSVGRLVPWKGFPYFFEAISILKNDFSNIKLFVLDDGPDKNFLLKKIKDLNLEENIILIGRVPQEKVYKYLVACDCFALVSSYEGFSHLLLETLALGVPVVTTPVGGNVEVIEDGRNGIFAPFGKPKEIAEAIAKVLSDEKLRSTLKNNAIQSADGFSEEKMIEKLIHTLV